MKINAPLGLLITITGAMVTVASYADAPKTTPAGKEAAVLLTGWHSSHELAAHLQKDGFTVNCLGWPGLLEGRRLTWEQIKKYNVLAVMGLGLSNADLSLPDNVKENINLLNRFMNEGGGVFFIPVWGQMNTGIPPQDAFLKPLGLTPLFDEVFFDPETSVSATAWKIDFAHTENVAKGLSLTVGVTSLWYPVATRAGAQNHSTTFVADKAWDIAIRGAKTAMSRLVPLDNYSPSTAAPIGHYPTAPPLVASRAVGKGRIVCFAITPEYLFAEAGINTLERIVFDRGLKNVPSHGYRLLRNALAWLAEPSAKEGILGGAPMDAKLLIDPAKTVFGQPFDWKTGDRQPAALPALPGVIGARSAASSGQGTVEDWVKQAQAQGLAYLVFLEEFAKLSKENFEELKRRCARLTTPDFTAIAGFTIDDEIGNHYFYFGPRVAYPDRKFLSKDGKVFVSYDPEVSPTDPQGIKGQLNMTTLDYAYTESAFKLTAGNFLFRRSAAPFANFFGNWDATGVITARDDRLVEDATPDYLSLVDFGMGPTPLAINLVAEPAKLAQCRWKTVLRLDPTGGGKIAAYWNDWHFYPDNPTHIYITSGPEIVRWSCAGPGDYGGDNRGDFVWQNYRWKLHGELKSDAGLKEVAVYDGRGLLRRFLPNDAKVFAFTLDLTNAQQHNLVLIATDTSGGRAISGEQWSRNQRLMECSCSDRNNQLWGGYLTNKDGIGFRLGQFQVTPDKRLGEKGISPAQAFTGDPLLGVPAFDGLPGGDPQIWAPMNLRGEKGEVPSPIVSESFRLLHTGDVNMGEGRWEHDFTDNIQKYGAVHHTLWKTKPAGDFVVSARRAIFGPDPDSPLAVFLWTMKATLKRDLPNTGMSLGFIKPNEARLWAIHGSDQSFNAGYWKADDRSSARGLRPPFGRGAYAAALDSPLGGTVVFSLTDGLEVDMTLPQNSDRRICFDLSAAQTPQRRAAAKDVSLLVLAIPRATEFTRHISQPSTEIVERFRREFGLDGGKTGYALDIKEGTLLGQQYIVDVDGSQSQCFSGSLSGDLVSSLPIRIAGLHDRWSAMLYDRGLKKARPLGVFENKAWAAVKLHGRLDLFAGHPILCDRPELFIQVTQSNENGWSVEIHNPTDTAIRTALKKNPFFDPFQGKELKNPEIEIPAGQSIAWTL